MLKENLVLNSLTFDYPKEPAIFYFATENDAEHRSTVLQSKSLFPAEIKHHKCCYFDPSLLEKDLIYTTFDKPAIGFKPVEIDFNNPDNENLVKRYYNQRLINCFRKINGVVVTHSGITNDTQVWLQNDKKKRIINHHGKQIEMIQLDRFTLKVRFDNLCPKKRIFKKI